MSNQITNACCDLQGMNITQKSVLMALANMADDDGVCWPSIATICKRTCGSERAVQSALNWLRDSGALKCEQRHGRSNIYVVCPSEYRHAADTKKHKTSSTPENPSPTLAYPAPTPANAASLPPQMAHPELSVNQKISIINKSVLKPSHSNKPRDSHGTQLPREWAIPDAWLDDAEELGMPRNQAKREARRFRNHYHAATGKSSLSNDWHAKWELWVDRSLDNREQYLQSPVSDFIRTHTDPTWRNSLKENFLETHSNRSWAEGL